MSEKFQVKIEIDIERLNRLRKLTLDNGAIQNACVEGVRRIAIDIANKISLHASGEILKARTGMLAQSWLAKPDVARTAGGAVATKGSPLVYAAIHEFGGMTGRNHMTPIPAREYVSLAVQDRADNASPIMAATLDEHIARAESG